jgi:hypothetical protein
VIAYKIDSKSIVLIVFIAARSHMPHQKLHRKSQQGSTLLLVLGLGLITTLMGMGLMMQSLKGRAIAAGRGTALCVKYAMRTDIIYEWVKSIWNEGT